MQNWPANGYHIMWSQLWPYCELMLVTRNAPTFQTENPIKPDPRKLFGEFGVMSCTRGADKFCEEKNGLSATTDI